MTQQNSARSAADDEIDLTRLWALLVDHRWQIGLIAGIACFMGAAYAFMATPIYRADALLQVEAKQGGMPVFGELSELFSGESSAQAEMEILRSRMVIGDTVQELKLDIDVEPVISGLFARLRGPSPQDNRMLFAGWADAQRQLWIDQLMVPQWLLGEPLLLTYLGDNRFELHHEDRLLASGAVGEDVRDTDDSGILIRLNQLNGEAGDQYRVTKRRPLAAIRSLQNNIEVAERGRNTGILTVGMSGPVPERVQQTLDAVARNYLLQNIRRRSAQAEQSLSFIEEQLPGIRETLDEAETELNAFRLESESVDISLETQSLLGRVVQLEAKLNDLRFKESEVSRLYTREHPAYRTLVEQRQSLEDERERLNREIQNLPETQQQILRLMRDVELNQEIYVQLLNRAQELRILKAGTVGNVRIIDAAEVQPAPIRPKKGLIIALSTLLGLMGGVGMVLVRAVFNRTIESPEQLEQEGIPVYATLPLSEDQQKNERLLQRVSRRKGAPPRRHHLLAETNPGDLTIEALRSLRTSLHFAMMEASNNVLMISGPSPAVGKSFISANLAMVLAQIGQKVVLVDGDLRKGHMHKYFTGGAERGLSNYLAGSNSEEDVVRHTDVEGLDFISRGEIPPNPAELLMHPRFRALMDSLSSRYDLVVIDTPPVLAVTDAAIIGQVAGTSMVVARYGHNSVKEVDLTLRRFEQNGVTVKGCILNAVERKASNAYSYYAYEYK
ncbi:MAG: polysaccharide biosynthesis tyrosine autokinase [Gammaproteobacteria bacterium]|nr:polysaccharide biosynthesis tyrosine autokinase [Gammaproteobacteria bacterium]